MTKASTTSDRPKFHFHWHSTLRGVSNAAGDKDRVYYGKVYRIPKAMQDDADAWKDFEHKAIDDLMAKVVDASCCSDDGMPAVGEVVERCDVFDAETGDVVVMWRVPYRPAEEKPVKPIIAPPPLSRRAPRAAEHDVLRVSMPVPPNASDDARILIGMLLRMLAKHADWKLPGDLAAEQRAIALLTVAAHEVSSMAPSDHRSAIVSQMGMWLDWLVSVADNKPEMPPMTAGVMRDLEAKSIVKVIDVGDDEPQGH